jgi:hypothetical protein
MEEVRNRLEQRLRQQQMQMLLRDLDDVGDVHATRSATRRRKKLEARAVRMQREVRVRSADWDSNRRGVPRA